MAVAFVSGAQAAVAKDFYFAASDGAMLHYSVSGVTGGHVLVFVPGWTMPGWIFSPQAAAFGRKYEVVLFDPRGQGESEIAPSGYDAVRRGQDISDLLARFPAGKKLVLVGWSLGVLDVLAYVHQAGEARLAGMVLIDNSVGENPPPAAKPPGRPGPALTHQQFMTAFVRKMFHRAPPAAYLQRLTAACLRVPEADAAALLRYSQPRDYWKQALLSTDVPVFYAVRPKWQAQAAHLQADRPHVEIAIFPTSGHALFIDDAARFDALMGGFLDSDVWRQ